jgi:DNA-binding MarR family transcriptional regulator
MWAITQLAQSMLYSSPLPELALGGRLKSFSDDSHDAVDEVFQTFGVGLASRWLPLICYLSEHGRASVAELAEAVVQTDFEVNRLADELVAEGLLERCDSTGGGCCCLLRVTDAGLLALRRMGAFCLPCGKV